MVETKHGRSSAGDHEKQDINIRKVTVYGTALLLIICATAIGTTVLVFKNLATHDRGAELPPLLEKQEPPPEPRLQVNPVLDLKKYRIAEEERLNSFGWVDRPNGVVRIPIDRALEMVARNGLPVRPDARIEAPGGPETGKPQAVPKTVPGGPAIGR